MELHQRNLFDVSTLERKPAKGGVLDRRLVSSLYKLTMMQGAPDKVELCETCGEGLQDCVGHYGVIRLVLPVFHIGYYKLMMTILQNICKTCSKVLVDEKTKRTTLKRLRMPFLDGVSMRGILKALNVSCKKQANCPHCGSLNGMVKKVGPLKIIHEKFKKRTKTDEERVFRESFQDAASYDQWLKPHIGKAQEDLNPLVVLDLFQAISNEVLFLFLNVGL
jgi:DNA-directed RNA polymerase III subunit RPC1